MARAGKIQRRTDRRGAEVVAGDEGHRLRTEVALAVERATVEHHLREARVVHRDPIAVSHRAANVQQAVAGAAGKLRRSIDQALDRQRSH